MNQNLKLLLIEDNIDDALLLERILKRDGFILNIKRIQSEEEMQNAITEDTFDLVISDYSLPNFSGPRAFEIFKAQKIDIPFILLSGNVGEDIAVSMMKAGVQDYIMKDNLKRIVPAVKRELEESKIKREKKQAQHQLLASEARYRLMFEFNPLPSLLMDFDTKQILQVNQAAVDLYGYSKDQFLGLNLRDLIFEEDVEFNDRSLFSWDVESHSMDYVRHRKNDGSDCFVITSIHNLLIENRKCRIIIVTDLTEKKIAEENLRKSEEKFRALTENSYDGIMRFNSELKHLYVNPMIAKMTGISAENYVGKTHKDLGFPYELTGLWEKEIRKVFQTKKANRIEFKLPGGAWIDWLIIPEFNKNEDVEGVIASARDITEKKRAELALIENEEKFRTIIEQASDGFILTDEDGKIIEWNNAMSAISGKSRDEIINKYSWDVMVEFLPASTNKQEIKENYKRIVLNTLSSKIQNMFYKPYDFEIVKGNNEVKFCQQVVFPIKTHSGTRIASMIRDITDQKKTQKIIQKYLHELEIKNAELERFTYTVSHDLKSPLITIKGYIGMLVEDLKKQKFDRMESDLSRISKAADKMKALLDDLLHLSRIGRILNPSSEFSVSQIAQEAVDLIDGIINAKKIKVNIQKNMPNINADKIRIREVYQNIVENAVKYMGDQSCPVIEIGCRNDKLDNIFFVEDNGMGIKPEYHQKIFGLFDKLDPNSEGTGIGLAFVKRIIEFHGGRIWVESDGLNKGATFCFTINSNFNEV